MKNLHLSSDSKVTLVTGLETDNYPINVLRNLAIKSANTKYILLLDADFQPSPNLEKNFFSSIQLIKDDEKTAFVVPAFEYLSFPKVSLSIR